MSKVLRILLGPWIACIPLIWIGSHLVLDYWREWTWRDVPAHVRESRVEAYYKNDLRRSSKRYRPVIEYEYTVDGRIYRQQPVLSESSVAWFVEPVIRRFPVQTTTTIKVHPTDPARSTLPGVLRWMWWVLFGVCLAVLSPIFVAIYGVRWFSSRLGKR